MIYLDNAATTFPKSERVYDAMDSFLRHKCVNAGRGGYRLAREATKLIDDTKQKLLELVGIQDLRQVVFTPSATIALNQIIFGLEWDKYKNVYITPFEHNAVMRPLHKIAKEYGIEINVIPFNKETWEVDEEELKRSFAIKNPDYIFMSHMSNVTGYILPCDKIMEIAAMYNPVNIVDCSQSLGTVPVNKRVLEADFIVFAGHKSFYGPMGIGGYIGKNNIKLTPVIVGGTGSDSLNLEMPDQGSSRYEAASYNIQAIAGLNEAIGWIKDVGQANIFEHKKRLTAYLIDQLSKISEVKMYLPENRNQHSSIVSINIGGWTPADVGMVLDEDYDIAVRTGYHCSPLIHDFINTRSLLGTVRISIGYFSKERDIDALVKALNEMIMEG